MKLQLLILFVLSSFTISSFAQNNPTSVRRCGTMEALNKKLQDPEFKAKFLKNQDRILKNYDQQKNAKTTAINDTIPVVVHIIMANPSTVTDATCQSQMDVLNADYQGKNADTTRIPAAFKPLFGKGGITFMLAKTAPDGTPTTGIERRTNNVTFDMNTYKNAKHYATGGMDAWNPDKYFNVWVVNFNDGTLGVSVFPGDPDPYEEHGYLCDYRCWGTGAPYLSSSYNKGRTATHEIGHFFNLFHIWGDDGGDCTGSDFTGTASWDDTPNQASETYGDPDPLGIGAVKTDNCSTTAPGYMYQNYMDYSNDVALVMFTKGQWKRIEQTLTTAPDRTPVLKSDTYNPPPVFPVDAGAPLITNFSNNTIVCTSATITPAIKLVSYGTTPLTSAQIYVQINGGAPVLAQTWTGNLTQYASATVTMPAITLATGTNTIRYFTKLPNGVTDNYATNDSSSVVSVNYIPTSSSPTPVANGFESTTFPPTNWSIVNNDNSITWSRVSNAGKTGSASAHVDNYNYTNAFGVEDYLKMPLVNISNTLYDSAFVTFSYAHKAYSSTFMDKLEVVVSTDCGNNWTSVWSKAGTALATVTGTQTGSKFVPTSSQWANAKVDLTAYRNTNLIVAFRNTSDYGQAIYIDDVNLYTVNSALPITLVNFTAQQKNKATNLLKWNTSSEINGDYFAVEKSADATAEFKEIARVKAKGNSTENISYSFEDNLTAKVLYYRLKMVDKDGHFKYSNTVVVKAGDNITEVSIYPNPAKEKLNIHFTSVTTEKITVRITDLQGRLLQTQTVNAVNGFNNLSMDVASLQKGIYLVQMDGSLQKQFKFIKD